MKVLRALIIALAFIAAAVVGVGLFLPDEAVVVRSTRIQSSPATVFTVLNGFHQFNQWSPWAELDPNAEYLISGPPMGVGARSSWSSQDPSVGSGSQEILEVEPNKEIEVRLVFSGFDADNLSTYQLAPEDGGTRLTWVYRSDFKGSLMGRYFGLMLDRMIGPDYEKGLAKLKTFVESLPKEDWSAAKIELIEVPARPIVTLPGESGPETAAQVLGGLYGRLGQFVQQSGRKMTDAPFAITHQYDESSGHWTFDAGFYLDAACTTPAETGDVRCGNSYSGWTIRATHQGPYADSAATYNKLMAFKTVAGLQDNGDSWEHYVVDPTTVPESEILTHIYWPVK